MILNVSGRTDIVAFYSDWFMNRYHEGFLDVRNPFYPKTVSRIDFKNVDIILFCTKNPLPIIDRLKEIQKPVLFHVTITPYKRDIEPNVPNKKELIETVKKLSTLIGIDNLTIRYDPVFISDTYSLSYHLRAFEQLCSLLEGYVHKILISFIDDYKNVRKNEKIINERPFTESDYKAIGEGFSKSATTHHMRVFTCFEDRDLVEYGFAKDDCLSSQVAFQLTGKIFKPLSSRKEKKCNCVQMVDIGVYNSCKHFCKYCYANYDEEQVINNYQNHNPDSSMLIGKLHSDDIVKERVK